MESLKDAVPGTKSTHGVFICLLSKWKADRAAVTSLSVSPDGKLLLSAGQIIKMWDLDTKEIYRVSAS